MSEIFAVVAKAIGTMQKLKEVSDKIKDADMRNLVADLNLDLADIKMKLAEISNENRELKEKILDREGPERCPSCKARDWRLVSNHRDATFGDLGAFNRVYKCSACGYSETKLITPSARAK